MFLSLLQHSIAYILYLLPAFLNYFMLYRKQNITMQLEDGILSVLD